MDDQLLDAPRSDAAYDRRDRRRRRGGRRDGSAKREVLAAVRSLPAQATIEDAIERLVLLAKIDRG
jgi:hypothetical protein